MKRVSFEVAKAIKEAGYPQDECGYTEEGYQINPFIRSNEKTAYSAPTYLDVWLWLWKTKNIQICVEQRSNIEVFIKADFYALPKGFMKVFNDPEEAIASAIEYLTDNDLIK